MTTIVRSNTALNTDGIGGIASVTQTAQEVYNDYYNRVTQDGGQITDPARTLSAIDAALKKGYMQHALVAVSAQWGVKLSGSNIVKFYGLNGNDGLVEGEVVMDTTTKPYALATISGTFSNPVVFNIDGITKNKKCASVLKGGLSGGNGPAFRWFKPNTTDFSYTSLYKARYYRAYDGTVVISSNPEFGVGADDTAMTHFDLNIPKVAIGKNGIIKKFASSLDDFSVDSPAEIELLSIGSDVTYMDEGWWLAGASLSQAQNLTLDVASR